jgi:hypothetical protein
MSHKSDLKSHKFDPKSQKSDLKSHKCDPTSHTFDLKSQKSDLESHTFDLKSPESDLKSLLSGLGQPFRPTLAARVVWRGFPTCGFGRATEREPGAPDPGAAEGGSDSFGSLRESERLDVPARGLPIEGFRIA